MKNLNFLKFPKKPFFANFLVSLFKPNKMEIKGYPPFDAMDDKTINKNTNLKDTFTYKNNIFWTPRFYLQKNISKEFLFELRKLKKKENWTDLDNFALIQLILTEAIRDTTYKITYNYKAKPTNECFFHGNIDILIYNDEEGSK